MSLARDGCSGRSGRSTAHGHYWVGHYALLPELISSLRERFPKIELELTEATSFEILDGLISRRFDVGFVRYSVLQPIPFELL